MTTIVTDAIKVDVFPDEFRPLMKAIKFAIMTDRRDREGLFTSDEVQTIETFLDEFCDLALEHGV